MLKFLLFQLIKSYITTTTAPVKEEKRYSNYVIGAFGVVALLLLVVADYIYLYGELEYMAYMRILLITSTLLLVSAVIIKLFCLWFNRKAKSQQLLHEQGLSRVVSEVLPIVVSMIPVGVIAYVIWAKIKTKFSGKTIKWKNMSI